MEIIPYTDGHADEWDRFVADSRNGTFFHTRRFLRYHAAGKFADHSLMFRKDDQMCAVLAAASVEEDSKRWLIAHPGASYGGLVLSPRWGMAETGEIVKALMSHGKEAGFHGIRFLRLTPPSVRRVSSDDQEYWLFQNGWKVFRFELATSLFLNGITEDRVLGLFSGKCRNAVRQGERSGLTVQESTDFAAFWAILETSLEERHKAKPTHTIAEIERLRTLCPGDIRLFAAFDGPTMVGGSVGINLHPSAIYTLYMAQDYAQQEKHPMHLILAHLAKLCIREGRSILHFGISTEDGGTAVNENLFFFKESFGGRSVRRESWEVML